MSEQRRNYAVQMARESNHYAIAAKLIGDTYAADQFAECRRRWVAVARRNREHDRLLAVARRLEQ